MLLLMQKMAGLTQEAKRDKGWLPSPKHIRQDWKEKERCFFYTRPRDTESVARLWKCRLSGRRSEEACGEVGLGRAHRRESDRGDF